MISLRPYQDQCIAGLRGAFTQGFHSPLLVSPTGSGKCLGKGTPVMLYDGRVVAVEDIVVGDLLMGPDSKPRRVESLARGSEMLYRVTPVKGDPYVVNESHILSLKMTGSGDVVNIGVRDYLTRNSTFKHCAKGWRAAVDFANHREPLMIPAYMMGVWLGDGASRHFSITTGDAEIAQEVAGYGASLGLHLRAYPNSEGSVNIHFRALREGKQFGRGGGPLGNALRFYGLVQNKHVPHRYKTGSRQERLELLAGVMDTDGHWTGKGFDLTLKSERLIDDVIFVARSLGFAAYKREARKVCTNNGKAGTYWRCSINGPVDQIPCRIERKRATPRLQKKDPLVTGISVEPIGVGDYYGFEVSGPDRLFLLGDFTVTHNTVMFSFMTGRLIESGKRIVLLCHREELIEQISRTLTAFNVAHGIISAGSGYDRRQMAHVASVFTLARRLDRIEVPDYVICDEAHHGVAGSTWGKVIAYWRERNPKLRLIGVTATPERLSGEGLGETFDTMVLGPTTRELIELGALAPYRLFAPRQAVDLSSVGKQGGDFKRGEAAAVMDKPAIIGDAAGHYRKLCDGAPAVAFCVSVEHAEHTAEQFRSMGYRAAAIDGKMDRGMRREVIRDFGRGAINVITSCELISEGFDVPGIVAAILLRPTWSLALYLQQVGRALRTAPGKSHALILDHVGNSTRHGMPDDDREWSLIGRDGARKTKAAEAACRQCEQCYAVSPAAAAKCRECGALFPVKAREVEVVEGELSEVEVARMRREAARAQASADTLESLAALGAMRGYKNPQAWARHVWNARQRRAG